MGRSKPNGSGNAAAEDFLASLDEVAAQIVGSSGSGAIVEDAAPLLRRWRDHPNVV